MNFVPELPLGDADPMGRHALRFTGEDAGSGRRFELVALPDGGAFDLVGTSGESASPAVVSTAGDGRPGGAASGPFSFPGQ